MQSWAGKYYYFDPSTKALSTKRNYIQARWGSWYLVGNDGTVQSGLQSWAGNYYYFDPSTYLKVTNTTININGVDWYFDGSGVGTKKASSANQGSVYDQFIAAGGTDAMWKYIVMHESGGNPNAVSPNGYRGLGQTKQSWGTGTVAQQTAGMINYAVTRYGSIDNAIKFRQANGWW